MSFYTYLLRCSDGTYYVGHTDDPVARLATHQAGALPGYTQQRRPVELVWSQEFSGREKAFAAERQIKGWSRSKKEALIAGDWDGVQLLAMRTPVLRALRDEASTGSASPQVERVSLSPPSLPAHPEEGLSKRSASKASLEGPIIILIRPQLGQNIGKAARAMLNFGLGELRLVAPRDGWPNPEAGPAAAGADVVLAKAQIFDTVAEAIADCSTVFASTVRRRDLIMPVVGPEEMAAEIHATPGRTAILFGPERSGLASDDVALATAIVTVPINPEFGSLNLAQAVILLAYEWSKGEALAQPPVKEAEPIAPHAELEGLIGQLDGYLVEANYFHPPERATVTRHTIRTILTKGRWSSREVKAMRGIIRALTGQRQRG